MRDVIRQFEERKEEIESYFQLLESFMIHNAQIILPDGKKHKIDIELAHILRANAFLLLYNLAESCISQGIEAIHIDIKSKQHDYNNINSNIQKELIKHIKNKVSPEAFISNANNIAIDILSHYPSTRELFSGNLDAERIKKIANKYGFSYKTDARITRDGKKLETIRKKRNHLAHGFISFRECGKDYSIQDMITMKEETLEYLEQILKNIESFVMQEEYKTL